MTEQIEPHSIEAEQQVIGAVLVNNDAYHTIERLRPDHFYEPLHARIWAHAASRIEADQLASPITAKAALEGDEGLKQLGGPGYLVRLAAAADPSAVRHYAAMVRDFHGKRAVLEEVRGIEVDLTGGGDLADAVSKLEIMLMQREDDSAAPRSMSFLKALRQSVEQMQEVREGRDVGIPTGLPSLDNMVSLSPKRYTVLGGSTSMGKTALAIWLMYTAAKAGHGVGYLTLEMGEEDIAKRLKSIESQIPYKAMDRATSDAVFRQVIEAAKAMDSLPIEIFSEKVRDVPAILSEAKRLKHRMPANDKFRGLQLLVIDYIQLVRGKGESAFVRLSQVANDLKQVAKILDVHVLALAQVDRKISASESFEMARPRLAHLRGSGDLENAPDNVMFIHRPEYYLKRQTPPQKVDERADWEADCERWKNRAEIIIEKARMGDIGAVTVGCDLATNRFWDLEEAF